MISAAVRLVDPLANDRRFLALTGSGHGLTLDDAVGQSGPKPIELVAVALGGCTAFDVISILRKKRQQVTAYEVVVEAEQKTDIPQTFTHVRIVHKLTGIRLDAKAVNEAIRLSEEKYCSVGAMIGKSAPIQNTS